MGKKSGNSRKDQQNLSSKFTNTSDRTISSIRDIKKPRNTRPFKLSRATLSATYTEASKLKFDIASIIKTLIRFYKLSSHLYLYCLKIVDRLHFQSQNLKSSTYWQNEIAVAVFHFGVKVFGKQCTLYQRNSASFFPHLNIQLKDEIMEEVRDLANGIDINLIFQPGYAGKKIAQKEKILKREAKNYMQMHPVYDEQDQASMESEGWSRVENFSQEIMVW